MSEENGTYHFKHFQPKRAKARAEANVPAHEHLFRVALGTPIIRWCERCGESYVLQQKQLREQQNAITFVWVAIQEEEQQMTQMAQNFLEEYPQQ